MLGSEDFSAHVNLKRVRVRVDKCKQIPVVRAKKRANSSTQKGIKNNVFLDKLYCIVYCFVDSIGIRYYSVLFLYCPRFF